MQDKVIHLNHVEECIYHGYKSITDTLEDLTKIIQKNSHEHISISVKIDGSPAIVFGKHPETSNFFIATKSIFNKIPVYYTNTKDIIHCTKISDNLKSILTTCFIWLSKHQWNSIYQGDVLFTKPCDIKTHSIDGTLHRGIKPNTIMYSYNFEHCDRIKIDESAMGISIHTEYTGLDLSHLVSKPVHRFSHHITNIFVIDSSVNNIITLERSYSTLSTLLIDCYEMLNEIDSLWLYYFGRCLDLISMMKKYDNYCVKNGKIVTLKEYIESELTKIINSKKTAKAKHEWNNKLERMLVFLETYSREIKLLFALQAKLVHFKNILLESFNKLHPVTCHVEYKDGSLVKCKHEGLVISGKTKFKLVDRYEFSRNNFSDKVKKGWSD